MKKRFNLNHSLLLIAIALISLTLTQCKKDGNIASQLDRSFSSAQADSALFSPFYDNTIISPSETVNATPDVNDIIKTTGVFTIITNNCATKSCHGGDYKPKLSTYSEIKAIVTPGNPEASKLWEVITTNDFNKAMPPVYKTSELTTTQKATIYNWIKNGANENPTLVDYRPAAIRTIVSGCASGNCHNTATAVGYWGRNGWIAVTAADTTTLPVKNNITGAITYYPIMTNTTLMNNVWKAYSDSAKKFYSDTAANASFRVFKVFGGRGPLTNYDEILMDIMYPKSIRSSANAYWVNGVRVNSRGDYLNASSSLVSRIDSTLVLANPRTGVYATNHQADMAWGDGGYAPSNIALIKAWYFLDPNVPDVWKYGLSNAGIFKYRKTGTIIKK